MPSILVVVPCFNEADRLDQAAFIEFANAHPEFTFLFVDDGSSDATPDRLRHLHSVNPAQLLSLPLPRNVGKAEAVRSGINAYIDSEQFELFAFLDADLSAPLPQLLVLCEAFQSGQARMVMGSRVKRLGAQITRRPLRHFLGRVFATFVSMELALDVYDSQCGLKVLDRGFARTAFASPFCTQWIFDVEILVRLRAEYPDFESCALEMPLTTWTEKGGSKISLASFLAIPLDVLRIRRTYGISLGRRGS